MSSRRPADQGGESPLPARDRPPPTASSLLPRRPVREAPSPAARPRATTRSPPPADLAARRPARISRGRGLALGRVARLPRLAARRAAALLSCAVRWAAPVHDTGGAASSNGRTDARRADMGMGTQESQPPFRQCAPYVAFVLFLFLFLSVGFVRSRRWLSTHGTRACWLQHISIENHRQDDDGELCR